ncbi:unnamed protein product, partial [Mesorhabditis spiculigera]
MQKTNASEGIPGEKCRVCGKQPARLCYGSVACGPCKTFFLRVATRKATYACTLGGNCVYQAGRRDGCNRRALEGTEELLFPKSPILPSLTEGSFCIYACGILVPIQQFYHTFKNGYSGLLQGLGLGLNPNDCVEGGIPDFLKATGRELHEKIFPLLRRVRFTFEEFLIWKMVVIFTPGPIGLTDDSRNTIRVARQKYLWMLSKLLRQNQTENEAIQKMQALMHVHRWFEKYAHQSCLFGAKCFVMGGVQAGIHGRETPEIWELEPKDRNMFIMHVSGLVIAIQQSYSTFRSGTEGLLVGMGLHFDPSEWEVEEGIPAFLKKTSIQLHTDIFPTLRAARFTHEEFLIWKMMAIFSPAPIGLTESGSNVIRRARNKYQSMLVQLIRQNCTEGEAITKMYALMKVHRWFERNANQAAMLATKTFVMGGYEVGIAGKLVGDVAFARA